MKLSIVTLLALLHPDVIVSLVHGYISWLSWGFSPLSYASERISELKLSPMFEFQLLNQPLKSETISATDQRSAHMFPQKNVCGISLFKSTWIHATCSKWKCEANNGSIPRYPKVLNIWLFKFFLFIKVSIKSCHFISILTSLKYLNGFRFHAALICLSFQQRTFCRQS